MEIFGMKNLLHLLSLISLSVAPLLQKNVLFFLEQISSSAHAELKLNRF